MLRREPILPVSAPHSPSGTAARDGLNWQLVAGLALCLLAPLAYLSRWNSELYAVLVLSVLALTLYIHPLRTKLFSTLKRSGLWASEGEQQYDQLDVDHSGTLSKEELRKFVCEHRHGQLFQTVIPTQP
jgi:hypothetical protein